jgi:di/tricarboxylate transporter
MEMLAMPFPPLPDAHGIAVLILVVVALILFTREEIPLETSSLGVLAALLLGFEIFPYGAEGAQLHAIDFFSGFGHEALIAVCALMIAGQGLVRTGALEPLGRSLAKLWSISPSFSLLLTLIISGALSAFVNNVPIVVLLLPILVSIAHRTGRSPTGMLMPMGLATLVGGMSTTIGTSTNLLVVSVAADLGLPRFNMFDFMVPAAIAGSAGIAFLWLVAPRILPMRETPLGDMSPRVFIGHLHVNEDSFANGATLSAVLEKAGGKIKVSEIYRDEAKVLAPLPDSVLRAGDRLGVRDTPENLKEFEQLLGASLYGGDNLPIDEEHPLSAEGQQIAEIVVTPGSVLDGVTLSQVRFAQTQQLVILALHRAGAVARVLREDVGDIRLRVGDVLLVQGTQERISEVKREGEVLVLDATTDLPHTRRAPLALTIMAVVVLAAALGIVPIPISAVCGVLLMIVTRCISWSDAAKALSSQVILIVVASLALGSALLKTGGADYLAQVFLAVTSGGSPAMLLSGLMLVMAVMTNIVSNNATAVIGTPIAVNIAQQLGLPAEPFVLAVLFGANMSYATPMAYKTNLLVMNAGGYRFMDFVKIGIPLTVIIWLVLSFLLPKMYGF